MLLLLLLTFSAHALSVCNTGWYHGYQGVGLIYSQKAIATDFSDYVIGGGIASNCAKILPSADFPSCAVIEFLRSTSLVTPALTHIVPAVQITSIIRWGVNDVKGLGIDEGS